MIQKTTKFIASLRNTLVLTSTVESTDSYSVGSGVKRNECYNRRRASLSYSVDEASKFENDFFLAWETAVEILIGLCRSLVSPGTICARFAKSPTVQRKIKKPTGFGVLAVGIKAEGEQAR